MNFNAIIALLIVKQVITEEEGQRLADHLHDKPQSTELSDAIRAVGEVIGAPVANPVAAQIGPVGPAQQAEEIAARSAQPVAPVAPESNVVAADNIANTTPPADEAPATDAQSDDTSKSDDSAKSDSSKKSAKNDDSDKSSKK